MEKTRLVFYSSLNNESNNAHYVPRNLKRIFLWKGEGVYSDNGDLISNNFFETLDTYSQKQSIVNPEGGIVVYLSFEASYQIYKIENPRKDFIYGFVYEYTSMDKYDYFTPLISSSLNLNGSPLSLSYNYHTPKNIYKNIFSQIKDSIYSGEVYQVNTGIKVSIHSSSPIHLLSVFLSSIKHNPSFYSTYCNLPELKLVSSSPELLFSWENNKITTAPIAGTYAPGVYADILKFKDSSKEISEHLMLVDLERNDLAKIKFASKVKVKSFATIEKTSSVSHLVSYIQAQLSEFLFSSVFPAIFPGGSISGCPKYASLKYIKSLEVDIRNFYTGTIGFYNYKRNAKFNILIRSIQMVENDFIFHVGSGIVYDSNVSSEWEEIWQKAKPMYKTIFSIV